MAKAVGWLSPFIFLERLAWKQEHHPVFSLHLHTTVREGRRLACFFIVAFSFSCSGSATAHYTVLLHRPLRFGSFVFCCILYLLASWAGGVGDKINLMIDDNVMMVVWAGWIGYT